MGVSFDISYKMHAIVSVLSLFLLFNLGLAWEETSSAAYITKTAAEKNAIIAANVIEDTTPGDWYGILEMPGLFTESMCPTLRAPGDELPFEEGIISDGTRYKYIHTVGTVGQVEWEDLGGHSYSGIFNGGSVNGWARLSQAKEPSPPALETAPGLGLKFLRDGIDSANLVAMYSVNGQESWNFFKNDFTTHIGPGGLELLPLQVKFSEATNYVQYSALSNWGQYGEDGVEVTDSMLFPYMLRFKPSGEINFPDEYVNDWLDDLKSIPQGTTLYQVWAFDKPEELDGVEVHIADLVLTSDMTTTLWGDKHMFFRHQDMAEDVALYPEWEEFLDKFGIPTDGCPVHRMMREMNRLGRVGDNF